MTKLGRAKWVTGSVAALLRQAQGVAIWALLICFVLMLCLWVAWGEWLSAAGNLVLVVLLVDSVRSMRARRNFFMLGLAPGLALFLLLALEVSQLAYAVGRWEVELSASAERGRRRAPTILSLLLPYSWESSEVRGESGKGDVYILYAPGSSPESYSISRGWH